jgi:hypothetical protein
MTLAFETVASVLGAAQGIVADALRGIDPVTYDRLVVA